MRQGSASASGLSLCMGLTQWLFVYFNAALMSWKLHVSLCPLPPSGTSQSFSAVPISLGVGPLGVGPCG